MLWLAIFVPALPLQVFTRAQLDAELPMAVLDARASARILLANDAACAQGVHADQAVAAAQAAARRTIGFVDQNHASDAMEIIRKAFTPEFRNRLDAIVQQPRAAQRGAARDQRQPAPFRRHGRCRTTSA